MLSTRGIGIIAAMLFSISTPGAAEQQPLKFEVASIKPHVFGGGGPTRIGVSVSGSLVTISTVTLKRLIQQAYDVRDYQIEGGPDWSGGTPGIAFDISARAPGDGQPGQSDIREMLRALLEERFKLAFLREMKEIAAYNLVIGKNGAKLKPSGEGPGAARLPVQDPLTAEGFTEDFSASLG